MTGWRRRAICEGENLCCGGGPSCSDCDCADEIELSITFPATDVYFGCGAGSGECQSFACAGWTSTATLTRHPVTPCRWTTGHVDKYCIADISTFRDCNVNDCDVGNCSAWNGSSLYEGCSCGGGVCSSLCTGENSCDDGPPFCVAAMYSCGNRVSWKATLTYNGASGIWSLTVATITGTSTVMSTYSCASETWSQQLSEYSHVQCGADYNHVNAFKWTFVSPCTPENLCMDHIANETFEWLGVMQCDESSPAVGFLENNNCGECENTISEYLGGYFAHTPPPVTEPTYTLT